ncbi:Doubled CXXCH motif (Paired_CXXCH_1) [Pirellulimonas nuda]|uniref:Doubled CXXCH motif (Paired_CXXCH_1) n=1 Tax=Pirellulimonas nuda TaxID=2528009 RepID=A0A518D754_9BACT|nr:cytochrome c3 family protein [Pirellulimonas nuda]QDU87285.1 Doubled CXXCH motif (Paired_CXXCH_1) [Pirellulimonas nuda]
MRRGPQQFAGGEYDRPGAAWVCGLSIDGAPCPIGPSTRGRCPGACECAPRREGDRWVCSRSEARGGPCPSGPTPTGPCPHTHVCKPARSLRSRRGRMMTTVMLFAVGGLAMLLGSAWSREAIVPGPLSRQHAQIIGAADTQGRCALCHGAADQSLAGWIGDAAGGARPGPSQPELCVKCHQTLIDPALALAAHSLPADAFPAGSDARSVACSACHQEHHGADHNLSAVSNGRCQACHTQRFTSLADHPSFAAWPYEKRTPIHFNHASHQAKHFPQEKQQFECVACHTPGPTGDVQLTVGYEQGCASCHDQGVRSSTEEGIAWIALPTLDAEALAGAGLPLANWPEGAVGDFDGELPASMKLLLAADPEARAAIQRLGPDFSFFDIDPDEPAQVADAAILAGAIQRLVDELTTGGQPALAARFSAMLPPGYDVTPLVGGAPTPWFADRFGRWVRGDPPDEPAGEVTTGWVVDDASLSLRYLPSGHADPWMTAWLDALAALPDADAPLRDAALREWAGPNSAGRCATCHSLQRQGDHLAFGWRPHDRTTEARGFTRFSHRPHLVQPELRDCRHCHQIDTGAEVSASYASLDPAVFVSEFRPIDKSACAGCHRPHAAGDGCTQCHNYHVDPKGLDRRHEALTRPLR